MPHPAIVCSGPQLLSVIEGLEAGTYPQPDDAIWRDDLPRDLAVRLALATGATMEQIEAGPSEYADEPEPAPEPEPEQSGVTEDEADAIIRHTHEDGTLVYGTSKGDGTAEILKANRFRWFPSIKLWGVAQSRDHLAKRWQIDQARKALEAAGFKVRVEINDTPRDVAAVKADRAERLDARADRLTAKAQRAAAEGEARRAAADHYAQRFEGGQPILVGHHSERGARADQKRMHGHDRAAFAAFDKAERASAAAAVVGREDARRERPDVVIRRIDKTEAELRQTMHSINGTRPANDWRGAYGPAPEPAAGAWLEQLEARKSFLEHQIAADRALLAEHEANGYIRLTRETVHKGDTVHWGAAWGDGLYGATVIRVNPKTVTLNRTSYPRTLPYEKLTRVECPHEGTETAVRVPKRQAARPKPEPVTVARPAAREEPLVVDGSTELFPTPPAVAERVIAAARLEAGMLVLEPSAGTGALALPAAAAGCRVDAIERDAAAATRLAGSLPGVRCADFLDIPPVPMYARVLMNPPFRGQADIAHVRHALGFVEPGGLLVAVMSAGTEWRQDKAAAGFRDLVDARGGRIERLPEDAFKASGVSVRTVMAVIPVPAAETPPAGELPAPPQVTPPARPDPERLRATLLDSAAARTVDDMIADIQSTLFLPEPPGGARRRATMMTEEGTTPMSTKTITRCGLYLAAAILLALLAAACGPKAASSSSPSGAAASSARAAASSARALKSSAAGQDAKAEAEQLADSCKGQLGAQGYNAMAPGVPGNKAARQAFYKCEEIPKPKIASWLICLARTYTSAPPKGPQGSAAESTRQQALTVGAGTCTATARGIKLGAPPSASPSPASSS